MGDKSVNIKNTASRNADGGWLLDCSRGAGRRTTLLAGAALLFHHPADRRNMTNHRWGIDSLGYSQPAKQPTSHSSKSRALRRTRRNIARKSRAQAHQAAQAHRQDSLHFGGGRRSSQPPPSSSSFCWNRDEAWTALLGLVVEPGIGYGAGMYRS